MSLLEMMTAPVKATFFLLNILDKPYALAAFHVIFVIALQGKGP